MSPQASREIIEQVLGEVAEHLSSIEANLLELEKNPEDKERIGELFRSMHTIKGIAGVLGKPRVVDIAHRSETFLEELQKQGRSLSPGDLDHLLREMDELQAAVNAKSEEGDSEAKSESEEEENQQFLIFQISGKSFAFPCDCIREISIMIPWRQIPFAPNGLCGMTNLRGQLVPVLDTGYLLGVPSYGNKNTKILFAEIEEEMVGFLVEKVLGVDPLTGWEKSEQAVQHFGIEVLRGVGTHQEDVVSILEPTNLWSTNPTL